MWTSNIFLTNLSRFCLSCVLIADLNLNQNSVMHNWFFQSLFTLISVEFNLLKLPDWPKSWPWKVWPGIWNFPAWPGIWNCLAWPGSCGWPGWPGNCGWPGWPGSCGWPGWPVSCGWPGWPGIWGCPTWPGSWVWNCPGAWGRATAEPMSAKMRKNCSKMTRCAVINVFFG